MDGLEPSSYFSEMLDAYLDPGMLTWARLVLCDNDNSFDVFIPQGNDALEEHFVFAGTLTAELLRLGVHRVLSGLTPAPDARFIIQGSDLHELDDATLDTIAQAALWGELRF
jgi:hypothetical protein